MTNFRVKCLNTDFKERTVEAEKIEILMNSVLLKTGDLIVATFPVDSFFVIQIDSDKTVYKTK